MKIRKQKESLPSTFLRAAPKPKTFDAEARTMEIVFTTGSRGLRRTWFGDYYEELEISKKAMRLDRMKSGAPVLANHDSRSLNSVIGVVESAKIENGEGVAKIRFADDSEDPDLKKIIRKIQDGIIRKVSVGYDVYRYEELEEKVGETPVFRATDWEPMEVSFVPVPFDDLAQVRAKEDHSVECEFILKGETGMKVKEQKNRQAEGENAAPAAESAEESKPQGEQAPEAKPAEAAPAPEVKPEPEAAPAPAVVAPEEKPQDEQRNKEIINRAKIAGLSETETLELVASNKTLEQASAEIFKRWSEKGQSVEVNGRVQVGVDREIQIVRSGMVNALLNRTGMAQLTDEGREYAGQSLVRLAERLMRLAGVNTDRMKPSEIAEAALSRNFWQRNGGALGSTDFVGIVADVANNSMRQGYEQAPQTFRPITRPVSAPDFKGINRTMLGEAPALEKVNEHGDFKYGKIIDSKETFSVISYGKILKFTRQLFVNDDMNALSRIPQQMGRAAGNLESDLAWAVITAGAALSDGIALFHSSHSNVGTTGAISETTLTEMRKKGRLQKGLDGVTLLNLMHKFLIVPAALETVAEKAIAQQQPGQTSLNPFSSKYQLLVEPRLDANSTTAWYGACDPSQVDVLEMATLEGSSGPRMEESEDFDSKGVKMSILHDVGVAAIDHRGLFKNAGA